MRLTETFDILYVVEHIFPYQKQLKLFLLQLVQGLTVKQLDYCLLPITWDSTSIHRVHKNGFQYWSSGLSCFL